MFTNGGKQFVAREIVPGAVRVIHGHTVFAAVAACVRTVWLAWVPIGVARVQRLACRAPFPNVLRFQVVERRPGPTRCSPNRMNGKFFFSSLDCHELKAVIVAKRSRIKPRPLCKCDAIARNVVDCACALAFWSQIGRTADRFRYFQAQSRRHSVADLNECNHSVAVESCFAI